MDNKQILDFGIDLVNNISAGIIKLSLEKPLGTEIGSIGASGDSTKLADDYSEQIVKESIKNFVSKNEGIKIILISEETGLVIEGVGDEGFFMILDPLDGSNNLRKWKTPSPNVGISLGLGKLSNLNERDNFDCVDIGIVKDIFNNRLSTVIRGEGSRVEGFGEITTSQESNIEDLILGFDLDVKADKYDALYSDIKHLMRSKKCFRRLGSSVMDIYKVACGEYDGFISIGGRLGFYDLAAVKLLVEEAGGELSILNPTEDCIIKKIIATKDNSIIKDTKYKLIASGNKVIKDFIFSEINK